VFELAINLYKSDKWLQKLQLLSSILYFLTPSICLLLLCSCCN
jgi:hypothetical protein